MTQMTTASERSIGRNTKITLGVACAVFIFLLALAWRAAVWTTSIDSGMRTQAVAMEAITTSAKALSEDIKVITSEVNRLRIELLATNQKIGLMEVEHGRATDRISQLERRVDKMDDRL